MNKDYDPESLILVDYDNTAYGFRIFDLLYFTSNMNYNWTEDDINEMLEEYVAKQDRLIKITTLECISTRLNLDG